MLSEQKILNQVFDDAANTLGVKAAPPTGWKCLVDTVTSATPNVPTEFDFGLADGVLSECVTVINDDDTTILVSLDGGESYGPVAAGANLSWDVARTSIFVKSTVASQSFTVWVGGAI